MMSGRPEGELGFFMSQPVVAVGKRLGVKGGKGLEAYRLFIGVELDSLV